jgi:hypothetical protein
VAASASASLAPRGAALGERTHLTMRAFLFFGRQPVHQLRPFFFDHLTEIAGNFREIVSFKQELVQVTT